MRHVTGAFALAFALALLVPGAQAQEGASPELRDPPQTEVLPPPGPETPADKEQDAGGSGEALDPLSEVFEDFTGGCGGPDGGGAGCGPEPDMPPPPQ